MSLKIGDRVYLIYLKKYGIIEAVGRNEYFVSFDYGPGFWYGRNELTEG